VGVQGAARGTDQPLERGGRAHRFAATSSLAAVPASASIAVVGSTHNQGGARSAANRGSGTGSGATPNSPSLARGHTSQVTGRLFTP
jgi:hypothetical protein